MSGLFGEELQSEEEMVLARVLSDQQRYRPGFYCWLKDNHHIFKRFIDEADKIRATGRAHYSARTIGEFLRHQTALRENGGQFKVNDHAWPDLARLYMVLRPEALGFFELRGTEHRGA